MKRRTGLPFGVLIAVALAAALVAPSRASSEVNGHVMSGQLALAPAGPGLDNPRSSLGLGAGPATHPKDEELLVTAWESLRDGRIDHAIEVLAALVRANPEFRLAQLVYADLLAARTQPLGGFGDIKAGHQERLADLAEEARKRLLHHLDNPAVDGVPASLLQMAPGHRHAVVVDLEASRLYVFSNDNGSLRLLRDHYVSIGKNGAPKSHEGDQRTPVGVYFTTGRIGPAELSDLYGAGAFPVNYPNEWDLKLGRTGYGIWIHGVPTDTYARAPNASDGCIAIANADLQWLWREFSGEEEPVIIADRLQWTDAEDVARRRDLLRQRIDAWRRAWESRDVDRYAQYYSSEFTSEDHDYRSWMARKRRINSAKSWIEVRVDDLSLYAYPGERALVVATFEQDYRSDGFESQLRKRQYWRREADGQWRIVFEGPARFRQIHFQGIPYSARAKLSKAQ